MTIKTTEKNPNNLYLMAF